MRTRFIRATAAAAILGMLLAACGDSGDEGGGDGATGEGTAAETGGGGDEGGGEISLLHAISGEAEQAALQQAIDVFQEKTGNTVGVESSPDFDTVITTRVTGGNAPDVALYPQPGMLQRTIDADGAVPLADAGVDVDTISGELVDGMVDTGTFDGTTYGVVVKLATKSLLWYAADDFEADGYEAPETWDDMLDLSQTIADSGTPPWCIGIEAGGDTGWVATDWVEDIMLRMHGPDVYDQWVNHEIPFNSPEVKGAFEELEKIWFNPDFVLGGTTGILQTPFLDSVLPMFDDPPGCMMHRQAGFVAGAFPEDAELDQQYGMTYLPAMDDDIGKPVLFSGDLAAIHTDNPVAAEFVEFLTSAEGQEAWMGDPGAGSLSVRKDFDPANYPSEVLSQQGEILANADFARFDGSDMMPGEVGAGAFWSEMVAWVSGSQDLDTTLSNIDDAWPQE